MFSLNDIKSLVVKDGAKLVIIKERPGCELDEEAKKIVEKQIKKATKLSVVWIPEGVDISVSYEDK